MVPTTTVARTAHFSIVLTFMQRLPLQFSGTNGFQLPLWSNVMMHPLSWCGRGSNPREGVFSG